MSRMQGPGLRRGRWSATALAALPLLAGCPKAELPHDAAGDASGASAASASASGAAPARDCDLRAVGLQDAKPLTPWAPPGGCASKLRSLAPDVPIDSEKAFGEAFACPAGVTSGIDFKRYGLYAVERMLSPAAAGVQAFDDGHKLTFLTRFRRNAPGAPPPMPISEHYAYLVPAPAKRQFAEATCTLP